MVYDLDPGDMSAIRAHLGPQLAALRQTMVDVDASPMHLFSDDRPRMVEARNRATRTLDQWVHAEPAAAKGMHARLPRDLQVPSVPESLLEAVTWSDFFDLSTDLFNQPTAESRVFAAAPHLIPLLDESGLVTVTDLDARPWGLHTEEFAFQYHQFLRRSYRSGIHYGLIGTVLALSGTYNLTARLALDERRLRFKDEYEEFYEFDRWYGRSLNEADLDDLSAVGETFQGDPDGGTSFLHPYAGLSVRWTGDGSLKTVEIEEFMPPPDPTAEWVFARYLHAIRDTERRTFVHFDGAVKAFAGGSYPRTQQDYKHRGKGDHYRKLFRIDGEFPASAWSELACSWFRGNRLIDEYFG